MKTIVEFKKQEWWGGTWCVMRCGVCTRVAGDTRDGGCVCVYTVVGVVLLSKCQVLRKLICDSRSSDSFAERSTVDYIVPGEMELMSAVR